MKWKALALYSSFAQAALRFGCSTVSVQRLDPLVKPGANPSSHVHQVRSSRYDVASRILTVQ